LLIVIIEVLDLKQIEQEEIKESISLSIDELDIGKSEADNNLFVKIDEEEKSDDQLEGFEDYVDESEVEY
jgi:hypothetical protein